MPHETRTPSRRRNPDKGQGGKYSIVPAGYNGKGWFAILRLYGPFEPRFEKTWRPGQIELVH